MISLIFGVVFALIGLSFLSLIKTYHFIPARELKRRARRGDSVAALLYKPVAYGLSMTLVLWLVAGISLALSVVLFADVLASWLAVIVTALIVWIGFVWIPESRLTSLATRLAQIIAPALTWILDKFHPVVIRVEKFVAAHRPITVHTGLYEKSDLIELLENQRHQTDNRIPAGEIDLINHTLSFGDKLVLDALVPKRAVVFVNSGETIGPKLMDELHKSGHSRFPVFEGKHDNIVGILYLRDLVGTKKTGQAKTIMKSRLNYVHEDFTLYQTLQAFIKTKQHLFLVVNSFEEFTGIITIEDVLEQMVGQLIVDEFDKYDDLRAVAAAAAKQEHDTHQKQNEEPAENIETTPEVKEVVK